MLALFLLLSFLGIDPGLASTGWAVIDKKGRLRGWGCLETSKKDDLSFRLQEIYQKIEELTKQYALDELAIEGIFLAKNAKTAVIIAQVVGVIKVAAQRRGLKVFEYTPLQIKMAITGYGRADKEQMMAMVGQSFSQKEIIGNNHAADAAACALTHLFTHQEWD